MNKRAKPSTTSAASTAFCAHKLEGPGGHLWIDGNGKITADNGTLDAPKPNAFSLIEIADCPGATETCKAVCYVHGLKKHAPATHALYVHNSRMIRSILGEARLAERWATLLARWIEDNCAGGFRWHVSGDVFTGLYAVWLRAVCDRAPGVNFWIYTRSFGFVPFLVPAHNLAINLSCDKDNYDYAATLEAAYPGRLRLCYLTVDGQTPDDLPDGSVIFPDYALRGGTVEGRAWFSALAPSYKSFVCPVDYHGKSENRRCGPCNRCLKLQAGEAWTH